MEAELTDADLKAKLDERFKELPPVLQRAVRSADVQAHMRALADQHKLHLDQWQMLENDVMLTLFGFQDPEELAENFKKDLDVDEPTADALAEDVSKIVFEPIRAELEKDLQYAVEGSAAQQEELPDSEGLRQAMQSAPDAAPPPAVAPPAAPAVIPATPPPPAPTARVERAPISSSYAAGQASHERKVVEGDPYREQFA